MFRYLQGSDFFISYSRFDGRGFTVALANALQQRDVSCFIDMLDTQPGTTTPVTVLRNLKQSSVLVVVTTLSAQKSKNVAQEVKLFLDTKRPIILIGPPIDDSGVCVWAPLVTGMPVNVIPAEQLTRAEIDESIVDLVINTLAYRRQRKRIRRAVAGAVFFLFLLFIVGAAVIIFFQNRIAQETKQLEQTSAELNTNRGILEKTNKDLASNRIKLSEINIELENAKKNIAEADKDGAFLYDKTDSLVHFIGNLIGDEEIFLQAFERELAIGATPKIYFDEEGLAVANMNSVPSVVIFDRNSSVLRTIYYRVLDQLSSKIKSENAFYEIRSYASKLGLKEEKRKQRKLKWGENDFYFPIATSAYSTALSKERANSVKTYFVNAGVPAAKLKIKFMGLSRMNASLNLFSYDWIEVVKVSDQK